MTQRQQGFSLVELSIVLVILGLLVGGILGGQSLIHAAELRSVGEEFNQWQTAVNTFKQKYFAIPGDMKKAEDFWPDAANGNGDGMLDLPASGGVAGETFGFWQQLSLAGLITGKFTGIAGTTNQDAIIGENVPASKFTSGGWYVSHIRAGDAYTPEWFDLAYGNFYEFGSKIPDYDTGNVVMSPEDAWNIDTKFDDGHPAEGVIIARFWNDTCSEADNGSSATDNFEAHYKLDNDAIACALGFRNAF